MSKNQQIRMPAISSMFTNGRPTIGLLIEDLSGEFQEGVWPGIQAASKDYNVNILCFNGGCVRHRADKDWDWDTQRNVLYEIARNNEIDGFIISGSMFYIEADAVAEFLTQFSHRPVITITHASSQFPSVSVDNSKGMRDLVSHLVENHKYNKFAFVKGPPANPDAEQRFSIFQEVLAAHDIAIDPECVVEGNFTRERGAEVALQLLDTGRTFDAIVCADDDSALGVIDALTSRGISVPGDVAVTGFDDADESRFFTPPLTTVAQPYFDLGRSAVSRVLSLIEGRAENESEAFTLDTRLVTRQSCGCFVHADGSMKVAELLGTNGAAVGTFDGASILSYVNNISEELLPVEELAVLLDAFCADVTRRSSELFLQQVEKLLTAHSSFTSEKRLRAFHDLVSEVWSYSYFSLDHDSFAFADDLLHRAREIMGDARERAAGLQRIADIRENSRIHEIGEDIANSLHVSPLLKEVHSNLPDLDLKTFFILLCEKTKKARLVLACVNGRKITLDEGGTHYSHYSSLLPTGTMTGKGPHVMVAEVLYFQDNLFGIMVFEALAFHDPEIFNIVRTYVSGALHSIRLVEKTERQSEELKKNNEELTLLRAKEHGYLEAIRGELELGRKIQKSFLPETIPQPPGWEVAETFLPAREVSGDFYDAFELAGRVYFVVADVSGKDVSAALFMSLIRTLLRVFVEQHLKEGKDPLGAVSTVNDYVIEHHRQKDGRCMFATVFFGAFNPENGVLSYANAGHNPPVIRNHDGGLRLLPPTGPAVGLAPGMNFRIADTNMQCGDLLFVYTDGVTEAQDPAGNFYGVPRLHELLSKGGTARGIIETLTADLTEFQSLAEDDRPSDDITMLSLKRLT